MAKYDGIMADFETAQGWIREKIQNQSLLFDLEILFATIPVVLFGKGAY